MKASVFLLASLLLTLPPATADWSYEEHCVVGGDSMERSGDFCVTHETIDDPGFSLESHCAFIHAENDDYVFVYSHTSLCIIQYERNYTNYPDNGRFLLVCAYNNDASGTLWLLTGTSTCRSLEPTVGGVTDYALDTVDADRDLTPDAVEWNVCGRALTADTVNGTAVPGHCRNPYDLQFDAVGFVSSATANADGDPIPDALEPAICAMEHHYSSRDGWCYEDDYHLPYPF